ncbi:hypothetical protein [Allomesorhizobium camelthorni]|uniref:Histidine phosphatase family protein n=1 Tax=Allomesorhizobium camelthorni TaxID=475069 RepID=A0A6G4WMZ6_9HYPH|nr:hypothetical protein [Mesorhizobium camelthorni]NGO55563.1 hypothetical protein [Mesorhizobium camelthorni]
MQTHYVFLMRHASYELEKKGLSDRGLREVKQIAERLGEYLIHALRHRSVAGWNAPILGVVIVAPTDEARATARALSEELQHVGLAVPLPVEPEYLSPERCPAASPYFYHWRRTSRREARRSVDNAIQRILAVELPAESNSTLVVGHAPQLGWFARRLTHGAIPIARAELACIRSKAFWWGRWGHLEWVLSPNVKDLKSGSADATGDDSEKEIREKIKGKMESAKLLGAVLTGLLTFVLGVPKDMLPAVASGVTASAGQTGAGVDMSAWMAINLDLLVCFGGAVVALVAGASLFFAAYFAYDSLLMPTRFWSESSPPVGRVRWLVARPPSSAAWVLYANMLRIWTLRFVPAIWCAVLAPVLLAYSLIVGRLWPDRNWLWSLGYLAIVLLIGIGLAYAFGRWTRPIVGAED